MLKTDRGNEGAYPLSCPRRRASSTPGRRRLLDRPVKPGDDKDGAKVNLVDRDDDRDKRELRERYGSVAPARCRKLTPGERSPLPVAGVRERRLPPCTMLSRPRPSLRQAQRRPAAEARARFLPLVSCRAVCRRRFRRLPRRDGGQRGDEGLLRLAQSVRGALKVMNPTHPSRRRSAAPQSEGSLAASRSDGVRVSNHSCRGSRGPRWISRNQLLPCTFYWQRSNNVVLAPKEYVVAVAGITSRRAT